MKQQSPAITWQTVERRIGRCGRRAELVAFLHSRKRMTEIHGTDATGCEYPLLTRGEVKSTFWSEQTSLDYLDGRRCVEFADHERIRPWVPRRVLDGQGRHLMTLRIAVWTGVFRTHWTVETPEGSTMFTITEPLRDGLIQRFVCGPVRSLVGDVTGVDNDPSTLVAATVAGILCAPLLLVKRTGRLIIRDQDRLRVGMIEHRLRRLEPSDDFTVHLDVDTVTGTDALTLIAATMGPMIDR